jgi:hypothetical protein
VSSNLDPFTLIKTAFRSRHSLAGSKTALTPMPGSVAPPSPSKGPPPLPKMDAPAPPARDSLPVEQLFFQEGIDGHAESVPPDGTNPFALDEIDAWVSTEAESRAGRSTIPPTSLDDEWVEAEEEEVEDPARTRRRNAARVATAWGTVVALAVAGVAIFVSPRSDVRSAAAPTSPPPVETTVPQPPAATSALSTLPNQGPQALPLAATPPAPPARATAPVAAPLPASPASCRPGTLPLVAGRTTCVDVAESFLCARDPRTHALRPAGCIDAKSPKAACESRGARLATSAERQQLVGAKGKTGAGAFRCAAAR